MNKRVHEIAKERGLAAKEVLARLQDAGLKVKAVSSSVDEDVARRVLGNGGGDGRGNVQAGAPERATPAPSRASSTPAAAPADGGARAAGGGARAADGGGRSETPPVRPRDGGAALAPQRDATPEREAAEQRDAAPEPAARAESGESTHRRPTRDSLQGE